MQLPSGLMVPCLEPSRVAQIKRLCDAIVNTARVGLDSTFLLDSLNECTANDFSVDDVVEASQSAGTEAFAWLALAPPVPRVVAELEHWAEIVRRVRDRATATFHRMWWLELIEMACGRADTVDHVLTRDEHRPHVIARRLFAAS